MSDIERWHELVAAKAIESMTRSSSAKSPDWYMLLKESQPYPGARLCDPLVDVGS